MPKSSLNVEFLNKILPKTSLKNGKLKENEDDLDYGSDDEEEIGVKRGWLWARARG